MTTTELESRGSVTQQPGPDTQATAAPAAPAQEPATPAPADTRVKVPALLVYIAFFAGGYALDRLLPLPIHRGPLGLKAGFLVLAAGALLIVWTLLTFLVRRGNPASFGPTGRLITGGPFRLSRHPLYLGGFIAYLGGTLAADLTWALLLVLPLAAVMQRSFVAREEAFLEQVFGDEYRAYAARVRRWI